MSGITLQNYKNTCKNNLEKSLIYKQYNKILDKKIKNNIEDSVFILEVPVDNYFETNLESVKLMLNHNYEGVYLSFQRPYNNLIQEFEQKNIDINKLWIIDYASRINYELIENENKIRCIEIPQKSDIEYIVKSVNKCIPKLFGEKKFVFIDSLSTFTLHESSSKSLMFPELLINTIRANNFENITFIFNIAEDLSRKKYMKNLNNYADEHIHLGLCT